MGMSSWIRGSLLGAGAFGQVHLAMDRVTGSLFAVKSTVVGSCNHHHQHKSDDDDGDAVEEEEEDKNVGGDGGGQKKKNSTAHLAAMENEIRMLQGLESEFVVRCLGSSWSEVGEEEEKGRGKRRLRNVFLEYMPGGSLSDLLKQFFASGGVQQQQQPPLDELLIRSYTRSILQGIEYLHRRGIVHGDIKAKNVLVGSNAGTLKLADFGSAKRINAPELGLQQEQEEQVEDSCMMMNGTPQWMAPEVVLQKEQGLESDIWSLGCTVVEMATGGRAPWAHIAAAADPFVALYCIGCTDEVPPTPASLSPQAHDFLAHCFQREPCKRWTAAQLLQHPFLKAPPPTPSGLQSSNIHHQAPVPPAAASSSPTSVLLDHATNTSSLLLSSVPPLCTPSFWKKLAALEFPRKTRPHEMEEAGGATGNNKNSNMWPLSPLAEGEWIVVRSPKAIFIPNKQFPQAPHELAAAEEAPRTPPQEQEQEQEATSVAIAEESSPPPSSAAPNLKLEIIILHGGQELVQEFVSISSTAECWLFSSECNSTQQEEEEEEEVAKSPAAELTTMESPPCRASSPTNCSLLPLPCRPPPGASLCTATRALGHKKLRTHNSGQCSHRNRTRFLKQQNLLLQMTKLDNSSSSANWRQFPSSSGCKNSSSFAGNWRQVWSSRLDDDEEKSHRLGLLLLKTHHHHQRSKCSNVFEEENFTPPPPKTRIQINNQELVSLPWFSEYKKKKKKKKKHLFGCCCCSLVELPLCLHCTWHQWMISKLLLHTITIHSMTDFTCEIVGLCVCVCSLLFLKNAWCLIDCKLL
jgi:serine/threonine protein kinase